MNEINEQFSNQDIQWCQELASTLNPFDPEQITPRQKALLQHFQWEHFVGEKGFELTQKILKKLHGDSQANQDVTH